MLPYLPDIFKNVVDRINVTRKKQEKPLALFNYGLYNQVWQDLEKKEFRSRPLIWLVMQFDERVRAGQNYAFEVPSLQIIIITSTVANYTQAMRDEMTFKPILIPLYDQLIAEIRNEPGFGYPSQRDVEHVRTLRPFWGGGEPNGISSENLFKEHVDAIQIKNLTLKVNNVKCTPNLNKTK